ncbi:MAG: hypothetical protein ABIJ41_05630 [Candidatus Omnitrophota bacterium]
MFLGTTSLLANKYYTVIDSLNPLFFSASSGRIIGIGLTILLFLNHVYHTPPPPPRKPLPLIFFVLTALGLTASVISNSFMFIIYAVFLYLCQFINNDGGLKHEDSKKSLLTFLPLVVVLSSITTMVLLYVLPFDQNAAHVLRAVLVTVNGCLFAGWFLGKFLSSLRQKSFGWKHKNLTMTWPIVCIMISTLAGLLFLGNVFTKKSVSKKVFAPIFTQAQQWRYSKLKKVGLKGDFSLGDHHITSRKDPSENYSAYEYEKGGNYFVATFSGVLWLWGLVLFLWLRTGRYKKWILCRDRDAYYSNLVWIVMIPAVFLLIGFINAGVTY